ncbi:MAG: hypothetical protein ACK4M1_02060 [Flavobacterium sp.]
MVEIKYLKFEIKIHDDLSEYEDTNSNIECLINCNTFNEAKFIIEKSVKNYNWKLGNCIDEKVLIFDEIENDLNKEQYLRAIELGESYIINTKPNKKS